MRSFPSSLLLVLVVGCAGPEQEDPVRFTVLALPDTQEYTRFYPELFEGQTQWAVDLAAERDVAMVTHLGDVVDNGPSDEQWAHARDALAILEAGGVPYGVAMGNHDHMYGYGPTVDHSCSDSYSDIDCASEHFLEYAGPRWTEDQDYFGGASPSGTSSWQSFEAGGFEWLFLHLAVDVPAAELSWAQEVLDEHPDALVHLSTHRYLHDFRVVELMPELLHVLLPGRYNAIIYQMGDPEYYTDSTTAEELWEDFVAVNPNIYMVQCGHVDAEYRQVSENEAGLPVYELLSDFQSYHDMGGNGWLKQLDYDLDAGTITVQTYSPYLGRYRDNGEGLDASLELLEDALARGAAIFESYGLDLDEAEALIEYWTTTEEGRQEYYDEAYGDGSRDSDFVLELDFAAYARAR
jgi:hypothetical protein